VETKERNQMLAYDYPLLGVFWTMFMVAAWAMWVFAVIWVFIDNFRRTDHSGWAKAIWALAVIFVPIIGVFSYVVTRPADPYDILDGV
jgi:hypothetical protein